MEGLDTTENGSNEDHEQDGSKENVTMTPVPPLVKICGICHEKESKYKCAKCKLPYCSVVCATLHRADHPPEEEPKPQPVVAKPLTASAPTSSAPGTVGRSQARNLFQVLEDSPELKILFMRYPRLRSQLRDIHAFTLPPSEGGMGMNQYAIQTQNQYQSHDQSNYRGRGGRGGRGGAKNLRPGQAKGPWNSDQGMQDAIDALGRAKEEYGKGGEGIREYVELVSKIVSYDSLDVAKIVQDEVAEENSKLIAQLLEGEAY